MEVSESKLAIAFTAVFVLGILLSILNGYYVENTGQTMPIATYGVAAVAMVVGALIIMLFQWKITYKQASEFVEMLPEDERRIIKVLLKERKIEQRYLVAESGLSKVKVSRIVARLEQRGKIEKISVGNTNLIKLRI